jgi:hypothetical protein
VEALVCIGSFSKMRVERELPKADVDKQTHSQERKNEIVLLLGAPTGSSGVPAGQRNFPFWSFAHCCFALLQRGTFFPPNPPRRTGIKFRDVSSSSKSHNCTQDQGYPLSSSPEASYFITCNSLITT